MNKSISVDLVDGPKNVLELHSSETLLEFERAELELSLEHFLSVCLLNSNMILAPKAIDKVEILKGCGCSVFNFQHRLSPSVQLLTPYLHQDLLGCAVITSLQAISLQSITKFIIPVMCPSWVPQHSAP